MKVYIGIACIFSIIVLVKCESAVERNQYFEECKKEVGATAGPKGPSNEDNKPNSCVPACMMKKRGVIVNGKVVAEKVTELILKDLPGGVIDSTKLKEQVTQCVDEANKVEGDCEVFKVLRECLDNKRLLG